MTHNYFLNSQQAPKNQQVQPPKQYRVNNRKIQILGSYEYTSKSPDIQVQKFNQTNIQANHSSSANAHNLLIQNQKHQRPVTPDLRNEQMQQNNQFQIDEDQEQKIGQIKIFHNSFKQYNQHFQLDRAITPQPKNQSQQEQNQKVKAIIVYPSQQQNKIQKISNNISENSISRQPEKLQQQLDNNQNQLGQKKYLSQQQKIVAPQQNTQISETQTQTKQKMFDSKRQSIVQELKQKCLKCFKVFETNQLIQLNCQHQFDINCLEQIISESFKNSQDILLCPIQKCRMSFKLSKFREHPEYLIKCELMNLLQLKKFKEKKNQMVRILKCPQIDCYNFFIFNHLKPAKFICSSCGIKFCFVCTKQIENQFSDHNCVIQQEVQNIKICPKCTKVNRVELNSSQMKCQFCLFQFHIC